jgi:hypothetical protein
VAERVLWKLSVLGTSYSNANHQGPVIQKNLFTNLALNLSWYIMQLSPSANVERKMQIQNISPVP